MSEKIWVLILCLPFCFCFGCAVNPITGQEEFMLFGQQEDVEIGRKYAPEIEKQMGGSIPSEPLQNYLDTVGQKIARVSHDRPYEYSFTAVDDKTVNAFALPGGYIFITKGMLKKLDTEAQLAAIFSHEIVHIVARDSSAAMSRDIGINVLLSAVISEDTPQSITTAANLTNQILGLKYSRTDEQQADMAGLDYLVSAGYNPYGMVETMQMLQNEQQSGSIEFLSTHPNPGNRVGYLTQKIQTNYSNLSELKVERQAYHRNVLANLNR